MIRIISVNSLAFVMFACVALPSFAFEAVATLTGKAVARDGDGVMFGDVEIRLQGIAAPEDNAAKREPGGPESTASLSLLVDGKEVICHLDGTLANKRPVAQCFLGRDIDIGEIQVRTGHARDCPRFSRGRYAKAEATAKSEGKNIGTIYQLPGYCR